MITLYSTNCPKCKVVELKLKQANIDFDIVTDVDKLIELSQKYDISSAPILFTGEKYLDFTNAINYIKGVTIS